MKLLENRVQDDNLHKDLLEAHLLPGVSRGKLQVELYLPEWMAEDDTNVSAYGYPVGKVIDRFIADNVCGKYGMLDKRGSKMAHVIIADLKSMIDRLSTVSI